MSLADLMAMVREDTAAILGTAAPALVTTSGAGPISTTIIWLTADPSEQPDGSRLQRQEPKLGVAIRRDEVPDLPLGSIVESAPPTLSGPTSWKVDEMLRVEPLFWRVLVVPVGA